MKGFIEIVMLNGDKSIESLRNIDRVYRYGDANNGKENQDNAVIVLNRLPQNHLISAETYEQIAAKIEAATEQKSEPQQDICDDLLLAEVCSLREKLKIASEIIKSHNHAFDVHQLGSADYDQFCEDLSTPEIIRQNIYYRTEDRSPAWEDTDSSEQFLVSRSGCCWSLIDYDEFDPEEYRFWAPVPKVEVR